VQRLKAEGAEIVAFDPVAMDRARDLLQASPIEFSENAYEACVGADALLILTEWPEFAKLDWARVRQLLSLPIVLDGKNLLDPANVRAAGLRYYGVGTSSGPREALWETKITPNEYSAGWSYAPKEGDRYSVAQTNV
jgi:UDPglucose 6-dehydrogenase